MSLNLKCSFLADYSIYHNKNYKVTAELTWDKVLLIILSPKLAWEKFSLVPPDTLVHVCCCFKRTRALKQQKPHFNLQMFLKMFAFAWVLRAKDQKDLFQISPVIFFTVASNRFFFFFDFVDVQDKGLWKQFFIENRTMDMHEPEFALFQVTQPKCSCNLHHLQFCCKLTWGICLHYSQTRQKISRKNWKLLT